MGTVFFLLLLPTSALFALINRKPTWLVTTPEIKIGLKIDNSLLPLDFTKYTRSKFLADHF